MLDTLQFGFGARRMPVYLQSESAECALACLAMVACHHGFRTDLATLRGRFSVSLNGATLPQLIDYADRLQLAARPLRLELEDLPQLATPCLLHWDLNHFVVLAHAGPAHITVHDPALGLRRLSYKEASSHFTGCALELAPAPGFRPRDERRQVALAALLGKVPHLWRSFGIVMGMALALEALALLAPLVQQWVVDEALVRGDRDLLNVLAVGAFLLVVVQTVLGQARSLTLAYFSTRLHLHWVGNTIGHLLRLPLAWFEKRHLGDVMSRFGALGAIQQILTTGFVSAILDGLMAAVTLAMMLSYSTPLSLVVLATVAAYGGLRAAFYLPLREAHSESLVLDARQQSCFIETIRAISAIKLAGCELERRSRWLNLKVDAINRRLRTQVLGLVFGTSANAIGAVSALLILWLGGGAVLDGGGFTVGMLFAFSSYGGTFSARMSALIDRVVEFKMLSLHCERLADIVLEHPEADGPDGGGALDRLDARIELVDVGFRYSDSDPWVLRHVNLVIEPGDSVAIVGPSGGGKTTLVKLILGILTPIEGEIRYGGVPLRKLGMRAYRCVLAAVMQDDQLLSGSLADNISFFARPADRERIARCAQLAAIDADINRMPMGYETLSGDMGTALSGGQKQRILLARALYRQPKVLVLDEATSHLDVALERAVNTAVATLDLTRIVVAHRPETIASARRVVALAGGAVAHDALLRDEGPPSCA